MKYLLVIFDFYTALTWHHDVILNFRELSHIFLKILMQFLQGISEYFLAHEHQNFPSFLKCALRIS